MDARAVGAPRGFRQPCRTQPGGTRAPARRCTGRVLLHLPGVHRAWWRRRGARVRQAAAPLAECRPHAACAVGGVRHECDLASRGADGSPARWWRHRRDDHQAKQGGADEGTADSRFFCVRARIDAIRGTPGHLRQRRRREPRFRRARARAAARRATRAVRGSRHLRQSARRHIANCAPCDTAADGARSHLRGNGRRLRGGGGGADGQRHAAKRASHARPPRDGRALL
mmetsp:Transcript_6912/g.17271  ORF Transcript_6912/g.17271 Transcript_6912/m.17271 type:complete len:228 (-) Transcript_6912:632-1315(-)